MINDHFDNNIRSAINSLVTQFQANPFAFLFENDIQCTLFSLLRANLAEYRILMPRTNSETLGKIVLNTVYSEVQISTARHDRIDIGILEPEVTEYWKAAKYDRSNKYDTYAYTMPLRVGIELKYAVSGSTKGFNFVEDDWKKLGVLAQPWPCLESLPTSIQHKLVLGFAQTEVAAELMHNHGVSIQRSLQLVDVVRDLSGVYIISPSRVWHWNGMTVDGQQAS